MKERETDRQTETGRQTDRQRKGNGSRDNPTSPIKASRERQTETDRQRQRHREKENGSQDNPTSAIKALPNSRIPHLIARDKLISAALGTFRNPVHWTRKARVERERAREEGRQHAVPPWI